MKDEQTYNNNYTTCCGSSSPPCVVALQEYVVGMPNDRALLLLEERQAVQAALRSLCASEGGQSAAAARIGVSQQAVNKAVKYGEAGPVVARNLCVFLSITMADLLATYGPHREPAAPVVDADDFPGRRVAFSLLRGKVLDSVLNDFRTDPHWNRPWLKQRPSKWWVEEMKDADAFARKTRPTTEEEAATQAQFLRGHSARARKESRAPEPAPATSTKPHEGARKRSKAG